MKIFKSIIIIAALALTASAGISSATNIKFEVAPHFFGAENIKRSKIEDLQISHIPGVKKNTIDKINLTLKNNIMNLKKSVTDCSIMAKPHPWSFRFKFEKITVSDDYINVIFEKFTVCTGSPDIEKVAYIFSKKGEVVPPAKAARDLFGKTRIPRPALHNDQLKLDEDTTKKMIEDSKRLLGAYDEECYRYLNNISYKFWTEGDLVFLFPEFVQPASSCQKEYVIEISTYLK